MFSGEYRRSPRIVELDAKKARERSQKKGNGIIEVVDLEELDKEQDILKQRRRRKKVKVRTVQDLILNSVEYKVQKTDSGNDEDRVVNAASMPSGTTIPEKSKLELLLSMLQRRDTHKIFAEPVDPEEVEYYYEVIKEPMDFGTVAKKLNEGSYQTLEEFEHDVFLVPNNAILFNASNTVYYRQARALKELATRLFHALKTDPKNFEAEASRRRMGLGRRTKAEVNSSNKSSIGIRARGYRAERRSDDVELDKRQTYRPWNSFLSENGSLVSAVYNSPQQLNLNEKVGIRYVESVKRFAKDLGPTAQKVAMKKVETYIAEALKVWNVNTSRQFWAPGVQVPNAGFASSNIKVAPSFKVPSSIPGCQNMLGDKMDFQRGCSNGGQASTGDTININNVLNRGTSQPGSRGKMTQSASGGFAPSMHLLGNSNRCQMFAGEVMDRPSSFWNRGKVSLVNHIDINDALNEGGGEPGNRMDFRGKLLQNMRGGLGSGAAFMDQSNGVHLDSSFPNFDSGKGKLDFTAAWNTMDNQKDLSMTSMILDAINVDNTVQTVGQASSGSRMPDFAHTGINGASSCSWHPPPQVVTELNIGQATDHMTGRIVSHYPGKGLCQKEAITDGEGSIYRANVEQGGQLFKPVVIGLQPLTEYCSQAQTISPEMASLVQQKRELDSLCEAPSLDNWLVSFPREHAIRGSSIEFGCDSFRPQTQCRGESSSRAAAAADRRQKQPMLSRELPQWKWL